MEQRGLIDRLVDVGVFAETDDGELRLSADFREAVDRAASAIEADRPSLSEYNGDLSAAPTFEGLEGIPSGLLAIRQALDRYADTLSVDDVRSSLLLADQLYRGMPRSDGSPDSFFPIRGDQLEACTQLYPASLLYVWLEDCDPCDLMRADLEELFPTSPDDLGVFSVYGPDWSVMLQEEYDVPGGPMLLFLLDGSVDTRYTGPQHMMAVENELDVFREIAADRIDA